MISYTVEPLNKGHFGSRAFVLFSEVVLWWEVRVSTQFIPPSRPNIPREHVLKLSRLLHLVLQFLDIEKYLTVQLQRGQKRT